MSKSYSTYEAKAKFSEVLRQVRAGQPVVITYHGEDIAEIRPINRVEDIQSRIRQAEERGILSSPPQPPKVDFQPLAKRKGGLSRFLESRD